MEEAGERYLLGCSIATNYGMGLEDHTRIACLCQVSCCYKAVVSSTGYYDIKLICHLRLLSWF